MRKILAGLLLVLLLAVGAANAQQDTAPIEVNVILDGTLTRFDCYPVESGQDYIMRVHVFTRDGVTSYGCTQQYPPPAIDPLKRRSHVVVVRLDAVTTN